MTTTDDIPISMEYYTELYSSSGIAVGTPSQEVRITSSTINGFIVKVTNRASVNLLGVDVLLAATTNVNGASVGVLVTER